MYTKSYVSQWSKMVFMIASLFGSGQAIPSLTLIYLKLKFPDGEITPLTVNAITQAMHAQCDMYGNDTEGSNYNELFWTKMAESIWDIQL